MSKNVLHIPLHPISLYHFPRLFTTNTRAALPWLIMDSHAAMRCTAKSCPTAQALHSCLYYPASKNRGVRVLVVMLMCFCGAYMMSSCGTEGANQTLRKLCHLLLSRSIQSYRSAVNWELHRGHFFSPWRVVFMCMCVKKKTEEKRSGGGRQAEKCIVDMLMLLTITRAIKMSWSSSYKTSARGPSVFFSYFILYCCLLQM